MAQIGTIKIQTESGEKSIPVYENSDSSSEVYEYWRVSTPDGIGFVPLTSVSEAKFPEIRIQSSNGVLAAHDDTATMKMIENWESGDLSNWENLSNNGYYSAESDHPYEGNYYLDKNGGQGPSGPYRYIGSSRVPERGDKWEFYTRYGGNSNGSRFHYFFGQSSSFSSCYRVDYNKGDGKARIAKINSGNYQELSYTNDVPSESGTWFREVVNTETDGLITYTIERLDGTVVGQLSASDNDYSSGEYGIEGHGDTEEDLLRII